MDRQKVLVIPCSGIGKAFGSVGREAAYEAVEDLRPGQADTVCLSLLVMGDDEAKRRVQGLPCITVDGCPIGCARKNVTLAGGDVRAALRVVDTFRAHHDLKPQEIAQVDEAGRELAGILAQEIAARVDEIQGGDDGGTAQA